MVIRFSKESRVEDKTIYVKRTLEGFQVIVKDLWEIFFEGISELSENFMEAGRTQPPLEQRDCSE
jgi:hypothetical protein